MTTRLPLSLQPKILRRLLARRRLAKSLQPDPTALERREKRKARYQSEISPTAMQRFLRFTNDPLVAAVLTPREVVSPAQKAKIRAELIRCRGLTCHFCGGLCRDIGAVKNDPEFATIEHITPVIFGGGWNIENLTLAHRRCNEHDAKRRGYGRIGALVHDAARKLAAEAI